MGISRISKIELIGLQEDKEQILGLLQKLEVTQLIEVSQENALPSQQPAFDEGRLLESQEALAFLSEVVPPKAMLAGMVRLKPQVYQKDLKEVIKSFDYKALLHELAQLRTQLRNLAQHKERLLAERTLLLPWQALSISLDEIGPTASCIVHLGVISNRDYPRIAEVCQKENLEVFCETVHQDNANAYLCIVYLSDDYERLETVLKASRFNFVTLSRHKGQVSDRLFQINSEAMIVESEIQEIKEKLGELAQQQFKLMIVHDYLATRHQVLMAERTIAPQRFTFMLSAWIRQKDIALLEKRLFAEQQNAALFISQPQPEEEVPVVLENPYLIQPFEFITKIYGFPKYNEIDPTPYLAPFFFLYFGFCVSDVGYGLILVGLCWCVLKKFKMGPQGKRFFRLFLYCGISTIVVGALTGSWFGNLIDLLTQHSSLFLGLKRFKDALIILDPMQEPTKLLGVALSFGILQVWFGNLVATVGNIKNRRYLDVLLDQVPTFVFLFGLTGLGLVFLKLAAATQLALFKPAALAGTLGLLFTQGRAEQGWAAKLFYGAYNLYSAVSGYLSDVLSYSRLWALGLVTGVMASTINLISVQFSQIFVSMVPFIDRFGFIKAVISSIVLIAIFLAGHLIAFLMNLLGAFVHPVRLQFVEFFSKFFKAGGMGFRPFKMETKYITIMQKEV